MAKLDLSKYLKTPEELDELYGPDIYARTSDVPPYSQLKTAMINDGFPEEHIPEYFDTDGRIHKFGDPGKRGDNAYWYQIHDNSIYWYGSYGSFRPIASTQSGKDRFSKIFRSIPSVEVDAIENEELEKHMSKMEAARRSKEFEDQKKRIDNLRIAYDNMDNDGAESHPYLKQKQIKTTKGIKIDGLRRLTIPLYDSANQLSNVQYIARDGFKRCEDGIPSKGLFHYISGKKDVTFICEGYATGVSLNMATGQQVICAMTAANLIEMSDFINKNKFKNPIVVADNDDIDGTFPDGKGQHYAKLLAEKINGKCIIIDRVDDKKGSDANDYMVKYGAKGLTDFIVSQTTTDNSIGFADKYSRYDITDEDIESLQDDEWLYENMVVGQHLTLIVADANGGKTTIMFQEVCRQIALSGGHKIFYFDEDSPRGEIKRKGRLIREWGLKGKMIYLNSANKNYESDMDLITADIQKSIDARENCTNVVIVFDTLRRFGSPNGKGNSAKEANGYTKLLSDFASKCGATCVLLGHCNKNRNDAGKLVFEGMTDLRANVDNLLIFDTIGSSDDGCQQIKVYADKKRACFEDSYFKIDTKTREVIKLDEKPTVVDTSKPKNVQSRMVDESVIIDEIKMVLWESNKPITTSEIVKIVKNRLSDERGITVGKNKISDIIGGLATIRDNEYDYQKGDIYFVIGGSTNNTKYYSMVKK